MDQAEAARRLSVAESEVVDVRPAGDWWEALYHDMASHDEVWRAVPGAPEATDLPTVVEPEPEPAAAKTPAKAAPKRRSSR
jgi:hypothetical protein